MRLEYGDIGLDTRVNEVNRERYNSFIYMKIRSRYSNVCFEGNPRFIKERYNSKNEHSKI